MFMEWKGVETVSTHSDERSSS